MSILEIQADFGLNLLRSNPNVATQSIVISPISISIALAMCYVGAKNRTADQIRKNIAGDVSNLDTINYFSSLMDDLHEKNRSYELNSANKIYFNENYRVLDSYKEILNKKFDGQFQNIDVANPEKTADKINNFVEQATNGKIQDIISSDSITNQTRMILTNAIYFKGTWQYKFNKDLTIEKKFYVNENLEQMVRTMWIKNKYPYYENHDVQVIGLPYKNNEAYLQVILPRHRFGLSRLLQKLNGTTLLEYIQKSNEPNNITTIDVELPRFKIETSLSLEETLQKIGIKDAFDSSLANFSGITSSRDLFIDDVLHKAYIETNEDGSEAAASTAVCSLKRSVSCEEEEEEIIKYFHADHPFLYVLTTQNGEILFTGTVVKF